MSDSEDSQTAGPSSRLCICATRNQLGRHANGLVDSRSMRHARTHKGKLSPTFGNTRQYRFDWLFLSAGLLPLVVFLAGATIALDGSLTYKARIASICR